MENEKLWNQAISFTDKPLRYENVLPISEDLKGKKVLDFGCGGGRDALELSKKGAKVYGIDICEENIKHAEIMLKQNGYNAEFKLVKFKDKIPYPDDFFDMISCNGVLHHIPHDNYVVSEFLRTIKKGGFIYLMVYTEDLFKIFLDKTINYIQNKIVGTWQEAFGEFTDRCNYSTFYTMTDLVALFKRFPLQLTYFNEFKFKVAKFQI